jgi:hypothetical protein
MRILFVLICSLALALVSNGAQEQQAGKEKKKAAPTKQAPPQHGTATGKPVQAGHGNQANKPMGPVNQPGGTGKAKMATQPTHKAKPVEPGKAKGKGTATANTNAAEVNKGKRHGKTATTGQAAGGQQGAPKPSAGKPGKAGVATGQKVKPQHFNLAKQPNTAKAPAVKFQQGRRIEGSQNWQGRQYAVFRNYHSEWHDQGWWHSHYPRITWVFGAPYYWNSGYWFPAWGYSPNAYYAWDGPIYAYNNLPPDQVTANVQASLQQQGYYHGEVDGLIGPLTREAIANYQRDHGLYTTSTIDQPTLQSLGMA